MKSWYAVRFLLGGLVTGLVDRQGKHEMRDSNITKDDTG